jgi:hypothetical protein
MHSYRGFPIAVRRSVFGRKPLPQTSRYHISCIGLPVRVSTSFETYIGPVGYVNDNRHPIMSPMGLKQMRFGMGQYFPYKELVRLQNFVLNENGGISGYHEYQVGRLPLDTLSSWMGIPRDIRAQGLECVHSTEDQFPPGISDPCACSATSRNTGHAKSINSGKTISNHSAKNHVKPNRNR